MGIANKLKNAITGGDWFVAYREIGREMRSMMSADGIQKSFPEDEPDIMMRRFVDFRISEDAIPAMRIRMDRLNDLVLNLLITLCTVHIP